jgi:hypothetical protein
VTLFKKAVEKTPTLGKRNVGAHSMTIATRNSFYVTRGDNVSVVATTLVMFASK